VARADPTQLPLNYGNSTLGPYEDSGEFARTVNHHISFERGLIPITMRNGHVSANNVGNVEHEMSLHQRGMVNQCFEEGQYDAGIAVLDQLRSSKYKPSA
jgi:pentatricopeptide repeat protein